MEFAEGWCGAAGSLGVVTSGAIAGVGAVEFAAGTKFVVDASADDATLVASGVDFSAVALTAPAGGVPVVFVSIPANGCTRAVATFATAEDAAKFTFENPRRYIVTRSVEEVGGKFVLKADIAKSGAVLFVR